MIRFFEDAHKYDSDENIDWISVTSLISHLKKYVDSGKLALKASKNRKSRWWKLPVDEIQNVWNDEFAKNTKFGTYYHKLKENEICSSDSIEYQGYIVPIIKPTVIDGIKYSTNQKLADGIYPEHIVYLKSAGICGQADRVNVINRMVSVIDYKTSKEIKKESYKHWDGAKDKMLPPLSHLDDCNFNHYSLQMSFYLYMILKHNPDLKLSEKPLTIHHIIFEIIGEDKYKNPIYALDDNSNPIIKDVIEYDVPYLKQEVISTLHWLDDNRERITQKKQY